MRLHQILSCILVANLAGAAVADQTLPGPIILTSASGREVKIARTGSRVVGGAPEIAMQILRTDEAIESAENGSNHTSDERLLAARELREAALLALDRGLDIALHSSAGAGIPLKFDTNARTYAKAAQDVLTGLRDDAATDIRISPQGTVSFMTWTGYQNHGSIWTAYYSGRRLQVRAYMFRVRTMTGIVSVCPELVVVHDDPTTNSLDCRHAN